MPRGTRLALEYLKAEARLRRHGVRRTVLVMGSTLTTQRHPCYAVARDLGRLVAVAFEAGGACRSA